MITAAASTLGFRTVAWYGTFGIAVRYDGLDGTAYFENRGFGIDPNATFVLSADGPQRAEITYFAYRQVWFGGTGSPYIWTRVDDSGAVHLPLVPYSGADLRRKLVVGDNLSGSFQVDPSTSIKPQSSKYQYSIRSIEVPVGARALRVRFKPGQGTTTSRFESVPFRVDRNPVSGGGLAKQSGMKLQSINQETAIVLAHPVSGCVAGTYYITLGIPKSFTASNLPSTPTVEVDCFMTGNWADAAVYGGADRALLIGVESDDGSLLSSILASGKMTLISHGRTDGPSSNKCVALGGAAKMRWGGRTSHFINWSDGSFDNSKPFGQDVGLDGARYIGPAAKTIEAILRANILGIGAAQIDFVGHSWGTYLGHALRGRMTGKFQRFFALDPARAGQGYTQSAIDFRDCANFSLAIWGAGPFGSSDLAVRADHSILLLPPDGGFHISPLFLRHDEPVHIFTRMLKENPETTVPNLARFAYESAEGPSGSAPWVVNRYVPLPSGYQFVAVPLEPNVYDLYDAVFRTDGFGQVTALRYCSPSTQQEVVVGDWSGL